ncbi:MAG: PIG-L family deacetylase [Alphaproteobacteria bacterium]|uniref:PIG-L family deacetylase n=1 Tax=Candidatus Nitrobium versatile TaxID=2884831 RepID=A0A953M1P0_9BACT|nr:PIG-L family deacetylase [Candidatus Nitrobium versatile]
MRLSFGKILALAAHLDDVELGCAGFLSKFRSSAEIHLLALSRERRNSLGEVQEVRDLSEAHRATRRMGLKKSSLLVENVPTQLFDSHTQAIREILLHYNKIIQPDLVLTPSKNDIHQDHRALCEQAEKVFKRVSLLGYEIVNSSFTFLPDLFVELSEKDMARKVAAVSCYKSQMNPSITTADYFSKQVIEAMAVSRGAKIGVPYAEAFEVYRFVVR